MDKGDDQGSPSAVGPAPDPYKARHPGERLSTYFENFFKTIAAISTLGASITFSKLIDNPVPTHDRFGYTEYDVQWYLGLSWLFFLLSLAFTSLFASLLSLYRPQAIKGFGTRLTHQRWLTMWYATGVSAFLFSLTVVAAALLSMVVVAYVGPIGWAALASTCMFGLIGLGGIVYNSPLMHPDLLAHFRTHSMRKDDPLTEHMRLHHGWEMPSGGSERVIRRPPPVKDQPVQSPPPAQGPPTRLAPPSQGPPGEYNTDRKDYVYISKDETIVERIYYGEQDRDIEANTPTDATSDLRRPGAHHEQGRNSNRFSRTDTIVPSRNASLREKGGYHYN